MNKQEIKEALVTIFANVFEEPSPQLEDSTTAADVKGWNSVSHIDMMCEVEDHFGLAFTTAEIAGLRNVGELIQLVEARTQA